MYALVHNTLADFDQWKAAYDSMAQARQANGVTSERVMRDEGNPNNAFILLEFADSAQAKSYFASDAVQEAMKNGGVQSSDIWYVNEA